MKFSAPLSLFHLNFLGLSRYHELHTAAIAISSRAPGPTYDTWLVPTHGFLLTRWHVFVNWHNTCRVSTAFTFVFKPEETKRGSNFLRMTSRYQMEPMELCGAASAAEEDDRMMTCEMEAVEALATLARCSAVRGGDSGLENRSQKLVKEPTVTCSRRSSQVVKYFPSYIDYQNPCTALPYSCFSCKEFCANAYWEKSTGFSSILVRKRIIST